MDIVERAGKIVALPFALAWLVTTYGVMTATIIGGSVPIGLYSVGKYIATGDGRISLPSYINKSLLTLDYVSTLPFNILMNNPHISITDIIKESNGTPKTLEEMKEIREKMDQDIAKVLKPSRSELIPEENSLLTNESDLFKIE